MASPLIRAFVALIVERPARRRGPAAQVEALVASGVALDARFRSAEGDPKAGPLLRHLVGIERWGQRRLRVALGDVPFERDEHHPYLPPEDASVEALIEALRDTRADTVALGSRVVDEGRAGAVVEHNSLGPLTAGGWLRYLRQHADIESRRIRARRG